MQDDTKVRKTGGSDMNNCGVSRWDDPDKINRQLKELTDQPIWEVNDDYYENVILKYYEEKCKKSS